MAHEGNWSLSRRSSSTCGHSFCNFDAVIRLSPNCISALALRGVLRRSWTRWTPRSAAAGATISRWCSSARAAWARPRWSCDTSRTCLTPSTWPRFRRRSSTRKSAWPVAESICPSGTRLDRSASTLSDQFTIEPPMVPFSFMISPTRTLSKRLI